jgi:hypothetical protein
MRKVKPLNDYNPIVDPDDEITTPPVRLRTKVLWVLFVLVGGWFVFSNTEPGPRHGVMQLTYEQTMGWAFYGSDIHDAPCYDPGYLNPAVYPLLAAHVEEVPPEYQISMIHVLARLDTSAENVRLVERIFLEAGKDFARLYGTEEKWSPERNLTTNLVIECIEGLGQMAVDGSDDARVLLTKMATAAYWDAPNIRFTFWGIETDYAGAILSAAILAMIEGESDHLDVFADRMGALFDERAKEAIYVEFPGDELAHLVGAFWGGMSRSSEPYMEPRFYPCTELEDYHRISWDRLYVREKYESIFLGQFGGFE